MTIELLNQDCMRYMATQPDNAFDLAIVDPPYGLGEAGKRTMTRGTKGGAPKFWGSKNTRGTAIPGTSFPDKDWDDSPAEPAYFLELMRVSKNQIIWGANHFIERLPPASRDSSCWIVWDKDNGATNFADCELAWTSFPTAVRMFKYRWSGMLQGDMKNKETRIHPTQKPVRLYQWLLANYAKPNSRILDTHLGSGAHAIAAQKLGFKFVGTEKEPDYFEACLKWYAEATAQTDMFNPGAVACR